MSEYYFLVSSLPYLLKDTSPGLTVSEFTELCREHLTKTDFSKIEKSSLGNFEEAPNKTLLKWQVWEKGLRNELVKLRAQKKGVLPEKYTAECEIIAGLDEIARNAFNQRSPLDAENLLDNARWSLLDSMEVGNHFNIDKLILYSLKLQLLEKKDSYNREKGKAEFERIYQDKLETIKSGEDVYD